jgi:glycosyltransferase involved in cell wall biosynthesis
MLNDVTRMPRTGALDDTDSSNGRATIAVIIPTFNHAHFLADAIRSVLAQTRAADEIIVVDDGSTDDPAAVVAQFPTVRVIRQDNGGLSAARNTGLRSCSTSHVVFLDADDLLMPHALEAGLACFARHCDCAFVYGGHRGIAEDGRHLYDLFRAIDGDAHLAMLRRNEICMIATVLFRRDFLLTAGGFDESLRRCEDVDIYLRITQKYPIAGYSTIVAQYRRHSENMSKDYVAQLRTMLGVLDRHAAQNVSTPAIRAALREGRAEVRELYASRMIGAAVARWRSQHNTRTLLRDLMQAARWSPVSTARWLLGILSRRAIRVLPRPIGGWIQRLRGRIYQIPVGSVRFGDLRRSSPISEHFGSDRGTPVDRYYIESFLARNAGDISGRVLEADNNLYTRLFGGARVERSDVISTESDNQHATIVRDLAQSASLPEAVFDCIILTQTLQFIFDVRAALATSYRALKPGGVLLVTVPGVTKMHDKLWPWYWAFTAAAVRRLLEEQFGHDAVSVEVHGNIFSATAFLYGIATEELDVSDINVDDENYPVIVAGRVVKRKDA